MIFMTCFHVHICHHINDLNKQLRLCRHRCLPGCRYTALIIITTFTLKPHTLTLIRPLSLVVVTAGANDATGSGEEELKQLRAGSRVMAAGRCESKSAPGEPEITLTTLKLQDPADIRGGACLTDR